MATPSNPHIRLIVTDLDGTLLNSEHRPGPVTERALQQAIEQGVLFSLATGKTFASTQSLIQEFDIHIPVICHNGTRVYSSTGTTLYQNPIPLDVALEALQLAQEAGVTGIVYTDTGLLVANLDKNVALLMAHHEPIPHIEPDLAAALRDRYFPDKLVFMNVHDLDAVSAFQQVLATRLAGRAQVLRSGLAEIVEVLPLDVTKGTALDFLLDYLDIPAHQTLCFGDSFNDLDMIQRAGIGVAMANAPADVRVGADYVTQTNDEDGVGHAINRFVLSSQPIYTP